MHDHCSCVCGLRVVLSAYLQGVAFYFCRKGNSAAAIPHQPDVAAGPSVTSATAKTGSNTCLSNSLFACMVTNQVFNRHRHNVPSLLDTRPEGELLKDTLTKLATFYKFVQLHGAQDSVVCDLSSNNLTFDHAIHISTWLRENSIKFSRSNGLDLSFNCRVYKRNGHQFWNLYKGF